MKASNVVLSTSTLINFSQLRIILNHIKNNPSEEGTKAKKACYSSIVITLLIIFLILIPLIINIFIKIDDTNSSSYPVGATKEVRGHIALYDETFWYTDSNQKYEFNLKDYTSDNTFETTKIALS